jgi:thymidylate synthase
MYNYTNLLKKVLETGVCKTNRTGVDTLSVFGECLKFNLAAGFPAVTTKKLYFKHVVTELLWIISGSTNVKDLHEHNCHIWDEWADENGDLGPVYGEQWRRWQDPNTGINATIDQLANLIEGIRSNPESRRHIISAWNVGDIPAMGLAPCHILVQFDVTEGRLNSCLYQRSADLFLGVPFNIASYALLTHMIAQVCGLKPGVFTHFLADAHIYVNHIEQVEEQVNRTAFALPKLWINPDVTDIDYFIHKDFELINYQHHPAIKGDIAI